MNDPQRVQPMMRKLGILLMFSAGLIAPVAAQERPATLATLFEDCLLYTSPSPRD